MLDPCQSNIRRETTDWQSPREDCIQWLGSLIIARRHFRLRRFPHAFVDRTGFRRTGQRLAIRADRRLFAALFDGTRAGGTGERLSGAAHGLIGAGALSDSRAKTENGSENYGSDEAGHGVIPWRSWG
jgi:hypothetical protein